MSARSSGTLAATSAPRATSRIEQRDRQREHPGLADVGLDGVVEPFCAEPAPNCSTLNSGCFVLQIAMASSLGSTLSAASSVAGDLELDERRMAVLGVAAAVALDRACDVLDLLRGRERRVDVVDDASNAGSSTVASLLWMNATSYVGLNPASVSSCSASPASPAIDSAR